MRPLIGLVAFLVLACPAVARDISTLPACETGELAGASATNGPCVITRDGRAVETISIDGRDVKIYRPASKLAASPVPGAVSKPGPKVISVATPPKVDRQNGVVIYRGAVSAPQAVRAVPLATRIERAKPAPKPTCRVALIRRADRRDGDRRYDVCVDDLDALSDPAEVRALYGRVVRAATLACPIDGRRISRRGQRQCIRDLTDEAVGASGIAPLALYHEQFRRSRFDNRIAIVGPVGR